MDIILEDIPDSLPNHLLIKRNDIVSTSHNEPLDLMPDFESVIQGKFNSSSILKHHFITDFRFFNKLLLEIHHKRKSKLSDKQLLSLLQYLTTGYLNSNDVRYFNEFLWFYKSKEVYQDLKLLVLHNFKKNLDDNKTHSIPYLRKEEVGSYIDSLNEKADAHIGTSEAEKLHVGLIGIPFVFKNIYSRLVKSGHPVSVFMVPYYTEFKRRIFLKSGLIFKSYTRFKGVRFPYKILNYNYQDQKIKDVLLKEKLDVGFFKLGFIVKNNIYDAFNIGLLHDHLAVLPFVRGRSSIEFSLLTGVPVGSTIHFIGRGIDTGGIVKIYTYDIRKGDTINSIRKKIKNDFENRIYDSLEKISLRSMSNIANDTSKGLTYYSIHLELKRYISRYIL
ncbi:MAG: Phosphoribosylglycinamide formyltransferase [Owenweeksia sp. TMED14]|nr:MAG: Phosphoribosylglycinamide formyltransferase [Owenweeksia sp. TMED14]